MHTSTIEEYARRGGSVRLRKHLLPPCGEVAGVEVSLEVSEIWRFADERRDVQGMDAREEPGESGLEIHRKDLLR